MTLPTDHMVEVEASLRVMGADLDPDAISATFGVSPDYSHRRGDSRIGGQGRRYADYTEGIWILSSGVEASASVESHLEGLQQKLSGREHVIHAIRASGLRLDILIGVFGINGNYEFSIGDEVARRIGALGLKIGFDLYTRTE